MRKKVRNNKTILASILALGCLTAASVGFSSWVIAAQDTKADSNVSVTVADVEDHRFKVTASSGSIIQLGPNKQGTYISYSGDKSEEALDFNFKLTFKDNDGKEFDFTSLGDQSFDIKFSFTNINTLNINDSADGKTYIDFPSKTIGTISNSGFSKSSDVTTATQSNNVITYNGKLAWGSYFGNKNPSELDDPNKVDQYVTALNHLKTILHNKELEIAVNIVKAV